MFERSKSARQLRACAFFLSAMSALFLSSCTKGEVELSSTGSSLSGPKFAGSSTITLNADHNTTSLFISGTCDARIKTLEIKTQSWGPVSAFAGADAECRDQDFSFSIPLSQVVSDLSQDGDFTLPMRGQTIAGATDVSTVIVQYRVNGIVIPVISFVQSSQTVNENVGTATVAVHLSAAASQVVTVPITVSGTATSADHNATNSTLTIPAGTTTGSYTFSIIDDALYEANETVVLTLGTPTNATLGSLTTHTLTIVDNDPLPSVFSYDDSITEGSSGGYTNGQFVVYISAVSGLPVTVNYTITPGTAVQGDDYVVSSSSGTLTIPAGSLSASIPVQIVADNNYEQDESFYLNLSNPVNATVSDNQAQLNILNDDALPVVSWATASQSVSEGAGNVTLTATLSDVSGRDVIVNLGYNATGAGSATNGDDFTPLSSITIPAGFQTKSFAMPIIDDTIIEGNETFSIFMASVSGATIGSPSTQALTIVDNDIAASVVSVSSSLADGWHGIGQTIPIEVNFTAPVNVSETPKIQLGISPNNPFATYATGSGTNKLVFTYTVQSNDLTSDLNYITTGSLITNGGSITANGANATLTLPDLASANSLSGTKNIRIDAVPPTPNGISAPEDNGSLTSSPTFTWTPGTDVGSGIISYDLAIGTSAGDTSLQSWVNVGNVTTYQFTGLTLTDNTSYVTSIRAHDLAGNISPAILGIQWFAKSPFEQQAYIKPYMNGQNLYFGIQMASYGDLVAVGVQDDTNVQSTITNGSNVTRGGTASTQGAVYVYARSGSAWAQEAYIKASVQNTSSRFGRSVALSGSTLVAGATGDSNSVSYVINGSLSSTSDGAAPESGAAYVFVRSGTTWSQQAYLKPSNNYNSYGFGSSVAISGDTIIVGAPNENSNQTTITNGGSASSDHSRAESGAAYIFERSGPNWAQKAYLKASNADASDHFGTHVAIDGDTIVVASKNESSAQSYITNGTTASADNSVPNAGAVYVFFRQGSTWSQQAYLKAANPQTNSTFGNSVSISGDTIIVGSLGESGDQTTITNGSSVTSAASSPSSGAAYVFFRSGSTWAEQAYLKAANAQANDNFGTSVSISGDMAIVGAPYEDSNSTTITNGSTASSDNSANLSGAAYVYFRRGSIWAQQAYLKPANTGNGDTFGTAVSIYGKTAVVGAPFEDSNQNYITNGPSASTDNSLVDSGAAYIFKTNP